MKNCIKIVFLKFGNNPKTVFFWHISKSVFPVFQFPLYMIFFRGHFLFFINAIFRVENLLVSKHLFVHTKKALADCSPKNASWNSYILTVIRLHIKVTVEGCRNNILTKCLYKISGSSHKGPLYSSPNPAYSAGSASDPGVWLNLLNIN